MASINLEKGQSINLEKENPGLSKVFMGLGWDQIEKKKGWFGGSSSDEIDLDASVIVFDENRNVIDTVWWRKLLSTDGSITHSGDNRNGKGAGDDERISVDLSRLPAAAKTLVFTINSYSGQSFAEIKEASARLVNQASGAEIAKFVLTDKGNHTAAIMASVHRRNGVWEMAVIGEIGNGRTVEELVVMAKKYA